MVRAFHLYPIDTADPAWSRTKYQGFSFVVEVNEGGALRRVDADALGRAMVDGNKDRDLAFARDRAGQVGAPECVHRLGNDGAVVTARASRRADPRRGKQIILAHKP